MQPENPFEKNKTNEDSKNINSVDKQHEENCEKLIDLANKFIEFHHGLLRKGNNKYGIHLNNAKIINTENGVALFFMVDKKHLIDEYNFFVMSKNFTLVDFNQSPKSYSTITKEMIKEELYKNSREIIEDAVDTIETHLLLDI